MVSRNCDTPISPGEEFLPNLHKCGVSKNLQPLLWQCAIYGICIQMSKCHKNGSPKNEISGTGELFFDFREMYSLGLHLKNATDSIIQTRSGFIAVNLILSTFPCTISRSSLLGGGVNFSPGQLAIALSSMGVRV